MAALAARAKSLFLAASDLPDAAERAAYLDRECGRDAELRAQVEPLLRANDAAPLPGAPEATVDSADGQPKTEDNGDPTGRVDRRGHLGFIWPAGGQNPACTGARSVRRALSMTPSCGKRRRHSSSKRGTSSWIRRPAELKAGQVELLLGLEKSRVRMQGEDR
jgi:hypothetical protein